MICSSAFGRTRDGQTVSRFTLRGAGGMTVEVLDYGAIVRSISVPDRHGQVDDVVLGYDDLLSYEQDPFFMGAAIGRYANRIRGGAFPLDGQTYQLSTNDGPHHLHGGGPGGFGKVLWDAGPVENGKTVGVVLQHTSKDGVEGYPGNLAVQITYAVSDDNVLSVDYRAESDRPTPVNFTQHSYFNLAGEGSSDVLGHELLIHAGAFTPIDETILPTGAIAPVAGTPLDFRQPKRIGARIDAPNEQLRLAGGYDHNFVLDHTGVELSPAATVSEPGSGRVLEVSTTEPGMQLYSGNFLDGREGKQGHRYYRRTGLCLETQHFPDSPNHPGFPSAILYPGSPLRSRTEFRFSVPP